MKSSSFEAVAGRSGSLEAAIRSSAVRPNDFAGFLRSHPSVELICFNGAKAGELFRRDMSRKPESPASAIRRVVLPSTSPAHATLSFERKPGEWRAALEDLNGRAYG